MKVDSERSSRVILSFIVPSYPVIPHIEERIDLHHDVVNNTSTALIETSLKYNTKQQDNGVEY